MNDHFEITVQNTVDFRDIMNKRDKSCDCNDAIHIAINENSLKKHCVKILVLIGFDVHIEEEFLIFIVNIVSYL